MPWFDCDTRRIGGEHPVGDCDTESCLFATRMEDGWTDAMGKSVPARQDVRYTTVELEVEVGVDGKNGKVAVGHRTSSKLVVKCKLILLRHELVVGREA